MEELEQLREKLEHSRPVPWQELPDLALYMDQVISYMPRQLIHYGGEELLTSAMVNNYIKDGLVPRAEGKRYGPVHLGWLTAVCAMKKVLPVKALRTLFDTVRSREPEALYGYFSRALDDALSETAQTLEPQLQEEDLPRLALDLALRSYANQLACERVLSILQEKQKQSQR